MKKSGQYFHRCQCFTDKLTSSACELSLTKDRINRHGIFAGADSHEIASLRQALKAMEEENDDWKHKFESMREQFRADPPSPLLFVLLEWRI